MYKCLNNDVEGIDNNFLRHMARHNYNTRRKENIVLPKPITNFLKRSFKTSAIELWYSIPPVIRKSDSLSVFKSYLNYHNYH